VAGSWIAFHVTDRCQLDCQHCLRDPAQKPTDLDASLIARVLDQVVPIYGTRHVSLTGGEPTLHPELSTIVDSIVDRGLDWHLVTNGKRAEGFFAMLRARPARLAGLTSLNFSVDGATESVHDAIRGSGSYREVLGAISLAHHLGVKFSMNLSINARNVHELEAFAFQAAQLGAARVQFNMLQPTGTLHDVALKLELDEWEGVLDRIARLKDTLKVSVEGAEGFPRDQPFHLCDPFRSEVLHVDVLGRLNLCCMHSGVPASGERSDVAGDLAAVSFVDAHRLLLRIIHEAEDSRLEAMSRGENTGWDRFNCNWCMKHFGKPHWVDDGTAGARASRERWRGAWDEQHQIERGPRHRLRVLTS
jgi:MoaA/NifB/PqqE/SkfB family radical SAM enzyme